MSEPQRRPADDLDPADPEDAKLIARQVAAARKAGVDGRDRARTTRGRADLEKAYDEGAATRPPAVDEDQADEEDVVDEDQADEQSTPKRSAGASVKAGARATQKGLNKLGKPLSKGSWSPTMTPPSHVRNAGGFVTGLLLYTGVVVYLRYGPAGWTGWLKAKFLNQPMQGLPNQGPDALGTVQPPKQSGVPT